MEEQIKQTLSRSICGGWDRGFLESILEQITKGRKLSGKQVETISWPTIMCGPVILLISQNTFCPAPFQIIERTLK